MAAERSYLSKDQIHNLLGELHTQRGFSLCATDSYNEDAIATKVKAFSPEDKNILFEAVLNNAIIGYGQKNFGVVKIEDKYLEIHDIYNKYGISMNNLPGSSLAEDELTPNRLMRFFRHYIRDWIKENKTGSYMWRKYSTRDPTMMHICFRGAEYLDDLTKEEADYLIQTTINMDKVLGTNMIDRVLRSFDARGQVYTPVPGQAVLTPPRTVAELPTYSKHSPVLPTSTSVVHGVHPSDVKATEHFTKASQEQPPTKVFQEQTTSTKEST
jgi:hypothetical protein